MEENKNLNPVLIFNKQVRLRKRSEEIQKRGAKNDEESISIEDKYFNLLKDFTILSGTVLASSIALSTGRPTNLVFKLGEVSLFISTIVGVSFLWNQLRGREWIYFFKVKGELQSDILINKDLMEEFEIKATNDLIKDYDKLMENNQKSIFRYIFKIVKVDFLPAIFFQR